MADGFLGRWSRRKLEVKQGRPVDEPAAPPPAVPTPAAQAPVAVAGESTQAPTPAKPPEPPREPPPTLAEAEALTPESDFRRFVAHDTAPEVKNAAMRKLFADPHFNVMDGMDVYVDDYSKPDPLPEGMLRSLASAEFLGFFKNDEAGVQPRVRADDPTGEIVAQSDAVASALPEALSGIEPAPAVESTELPAQDADPDLRLQQDHAPGPEGPGHGTA